MNHAMRYLLWLNRLTGGRIVERQVVVEGFGMAVLTPLGVSAARNLGVLPQHIDWAVA